MQSALLLSLALPLFASPQDQDERPVVFVDELAFEQAFGAGAPAADQISIATLRGKVFILEFWATW